MNPEHLLDLSTDTGVARPSQRALEIMAKYTSAPAPAASSSSRKPEVMLAPTKPLKDIPLTYFEQKAKAIAVGRSAGTMAAALAAAQAAAVSAALRASGPPGKGRASRAVAMAKAARDDLPVALGGRAETELPSASSTPRVAAEAPSITDAIPELEERWSARCDFSRVFCVRYSPDCSLLAAGCDEGAVVVFHASSGRVAYTLCHDDDSGSGRLPVTCMRWRPAGSGRLLLVANAAGTLERWQVGTSPKVIDAVVEDDNQIYALDWRPDAGQVATAGRE